jgi:hypothetical protein
VRKQKCVICGRDKRFEQTFSFPGRLLALGHQHGDKAHLSCIEEKEDDGGKSQGGGPNACSGSSPTRTRAQPSRSVASAPEGSINRTLVCRTAIATSRTCEKIRLEDS